MKQQGIAKNTIFYTSALIIQKILSFIYFWFISNSLEPENLGKYVFALSFTILFSIFADIGLAPIVIRESSKFKDKANEFLKNILALKIPLAFVAIIAAVFFINVTGKSSDIRFFVYLASFIMILDSFTAHFWGIFRSLQNLKYESIATILVQIIIFALGITALKTTGKVSFLIGALIVASIFNFTFSIILLKIKLHFSLSPQWNSKIIKHFIKIVPAFAFGSIFVRIYNSSDTVLLGFLASESAVGFYSIPAKIITSLQHIIPLAFVSVIYPVFSSHFKKSQKILQSVFEKSFSYILIISLPISTGLLFLSSEIINRIWPGYQTIIPTFVVMTLAIPFLFLSFPSGYLLNACNKQKNNTINRGIITFCAIVLNIILIPKYNVLGVGITFLAVNILLFLLDIYWIKKIISVNWLLLLKTFSKSLFSSIIMLLVLILVLTKIHLIFAIIVGAITYFVVLFIIRGFNTREIKQLLKSFY